MTDPLNETPEEVIARAMRSIDAMLDGPPVGSLPIVREPLSRIMSATFPAFCAAMQTERTLCTAPSIVQACTLALLVNILREASVVIEPNPEKIPRAMIHYAGKIAQLVAEDIESGVWAKHERLARMEDIDAGN